VYKRQELLSGKTIFPGKNVVKLMRTKLHAEELPIPDGPPIPSGLEAIVRKLAHLDPEERYQSAEQALEDLSALSNPASRSRLYLGIAALVGIIVAVALAINVAL